MVELITYLYVHNSDILKSTFSDHFYPPTFSFFLPPLLYFPSPFQSLSPLPPPSPYPISFSYSIFFSLSFHNHAMECLFMDA